MLAIAVIAVGAMIFIKRRRRKVEEVEAKTEEYAQIEN